MKKEWDLRVYIDLFAGAGRARIRGSRRLVETAALRVLSISDPFDRYIFCELDSEKLTALESRIGTTHTDRNTVCLNIDSNADVARIMAQLPAYHAGQKVLTFCFVDPFRIRHLEFSTIRRLADRFVDFLVLLPTGMDPGRNEEPYSHQENIIVSAFTGKSNWRKDRRQEPGIPFGDFVALEFGRSMQDLGYLSTSLADMHDMKNSKNRGLYRLAMFSRHPRGIDFWDKCRTATAAQRKLF